MSGSTINKMGLLELRRVFLICDGGYHTWPQLRAPYQDQLDDSAKGIRRDHLELAKKDVESCFFRILKKAEVIRDPQDPMRLHNSKQIRNVVITCC